MPGVYVGEPIYAAAGRPQTLYHAGTGKAFQPGDRIDQEFTVEMLASMLRTGAGVYEPPISTRAKSPTARSRRNG